MQVEYVVVLVVVVALVALTFKKSKPKRDVNAPTPGNGGGDNLPPKQQK